MAVSGNNTIKINFLLAITYCNQVYEMARLGTSLHTKKLGGKSKCSMCCPRFKTNGYMLFIYLLNQKQRMDSIFPFFSHRPAVHAHILPLSSSFSQSYSCSWNCLSFHLLFFKD